MMDHVCAQTSTLVVSHVESGSQWGMDIQVSDLETEDLPPPPPQSQGPKTDLEIISQRWYQTC
eukprot:3519157-Amphidinium_carterae.1